MTGKDLLEAMGLVDERYVDEAENKRLKRGVPMGWLSMAACLCILIAGAIFWLQPEVSNDCAVMENAAGSFMPEQETMASMEQAPGSPEMDDCEGTYEVNSDPAVYIRILEWRPDGFVGEVEAVSCADSGDMESGTLLTVYFDENTSVLIRMDGQSHRSENRMPTEEDFPLGTLVRVQYRAVAEDGSVVATVIDAVGED